jgi:hypothetical protein
METRPDRDTDDYLDEEPREEIARFDTGLRVLLTVLFGVIWGIVEAILGLIVVFGLGWMLVTRRAPPPRVREISNQLVTYSYRIWRYLTQNEAEIPFPFSEFPALLERSSDLGTDSAIELKEQLGEVVDVVERQIASATRSKRRHDDD